MIIGTGFSSFGYLDALSVDYFETDGLFVRVLAHHKAHREFVKSINDIRKVIGNKTFAEYVECSDSLSLFETVSLAQTGMEIPYSPAS